MNRKYFLLMLTMIGASICVTAKGERDKKAENAFLEYYRKLDRNRTSHMNNNVERKKSLESAKDEHPLLKEQLSPENKMKGERDKKAENAFIGYYRNLDKNRTSHMNSNVERKKSLESTNDEHSPLKEQLSPENKMKGERDKKAENAFLEYYRNLDKNRTSHMNNNVERNESLESTKDEYSSLKGQLSPENKTKGERDKNAENAFLEYYRNLDKNRTSHMNKNVERNESLESTNDEHSPLKGQLSPENKASSNHFEKEKKPVKNIRIRLLPKQPQKTKLK